MEKGPSLITKDYFEKRNTSVLNDRTKDNIELELLTKVVDHSITETGRSHLYHSIENPSISLQEINAKQDALRELRANDKLRQNIVDLLERVKRYEKSSLTFLDRAFNFGADEYDTLPNTRELIRNLSSWGRELSEPETPYLKQLKGEILSLKDSGVEKLARGPIFRKLLKKEVVGLREIGKGNFLISPFPYYNLHTKIGQTLLGAGAGSAAFYYAIESKASPDIMFFTALLPLIGGGIGKMIGKLRDNYNFHNPLKKRFLNESQNAFRAIGSLDELISFDEFGREMKFSTLPQMEDGDKDYFEADSFINPVKFKGVLANHNCDCDDDCDKENGPNYYVKPIPDYVANSIILGNESTLKFLTGPNSGGKTSAAKAIIQARILGQAGCYVPAKRAKMNIAHQLHYQVGQNDSQASEEGGLGTQFLQTKEILFNGNQRSFVVIDDLIEGTTVEEKLNHTRNQLYGFLHKGINLLYITHHHELADEFKRKGVGSYSQVEFCGENPTYKIIPGISKNSHSDVVAKRVGFDEEAIRQHLISQKYLSPNQKLSDVGKYSIRD